jgi:hypothetical protein
MRPNQRPMFLLRHSIRLKMTTLTSLLGVLGGFCFAIAGIPSAYRAIKDGKTFVPALTSWPIFIGVVLLYLYLLLTYGFNPILACVYGVEGLSWAVVLKYTHFPTYKCMGLRPWS